MSLRGRLLLALVVVVLAGLVVADVATYQALRSFLVHQVDDQLTGQLDPVLHGHAGPGTRGGAHELGGGAATYTEIRASDGRTLSLSNTDNFGRPMSTTPDLPARLPLPAACTDEHNSCPSTALIVSSRELGGPDYRVRVWRLPLTDGSEVQLVIALPLANMSGTLNQLLWIEGGVTAAVLLFAGISGFYLVRLGLRPLDEIEATAGAIAAGDLSRRVARAETRTEVGRLGIALNTMLGRIETAFAEKDASEQRLRRFLADASHELRTPLTSIRGYAELFRRGAADRPQDLARVMLRIEEEGARMGVLVDDLLLLARLDQGRPLEQRPVDLSALVSEAVDAARVVEPERQIDLSAAPGFEVTGDEVRLRQVLDNLLANIRTHTPPGTPARVTLSRVGTTVQVDVVDFGPGLPAEGRELVFNRFFRADPGRSRDRGGAGLGLAISHAIVAAHGGSLEALDTEPHGTTMRIHLPAENPPPILSE